MKLFLGALLVCFIGGLVAQPGYTRLRVPLLGAVCVLVCIGYYFVHQI